MAFPADYKRVQIPGGSTGVVAVQLGLARQLLVDTNTWTLHLMDGATPGGHKVLMQSQFSTFFQAASYGEVAYVLNGTDGADPERNRTWAAPVLKELFDKFLDTTVPSDWFLKDSGARPNFRNIGTEIVNPDIALTAGFYRMDPSVAVNLPAEVPTDNSVQLMMTVMTESIDNLIQLLYIRDDTGKIWSRSMIDGVFSDWVLATGVTSGDLANYVAKAGGTMVGQLILAAAELGFASIRIPDKNAVPGAPVDGDIWRDDSLGGLRFRKAGVTVGLLDSQATIRKAIAILGDVKAQNAASQALTAATWVTRHLNTEISDPDGLVTIASNEFTLVAGSDFLATVLAQANNASGNASKLRIYNVTDGVPVNNHLFHLFNVGGSTGVNGASTPIIALLEGGKTYRVEQKNSQTTTPASPCNETGMSEIYMTVTLERMRHVIA